jgi:puromycin-sensitive aminopeptidase
VSTDPYRLDRRAVPRHYDLIIEPDAAAGTFTGTVTIDLDVVTPCDALVCNAADLELAAAWVVTPAGQRHDATVSVDTEAERITVDPGATLHPGPHQLHLSFSGRLDGRLRGVYRSSWNDEAGDAQHLVVTQFEPTDARRAFPCWDEPAFKATFGITLIVPNGHVAVSNAAEIDRQPHTGTNDDTDKVVVRFADTMVMSTYLVAFVVGPLDITEATDAGGVPVRIVHRPGMAHLANYGREVAAFCLDYFAEYYAIPYPGDKLDLVAIPDFAFGAMENLGCVTFREVLLLVDPDEATQPELQNVTDVIAHELAHMWFGDLVTMDWWEGIWLNEAFATFMEMAATDAFRPDWDRWTSFGVARTAAFDVDALRGTRPVEFPVVSPDEAEAMFDILTYEKGAAVLRMLEQWLGPDGFRAGIRRYLSQHAYANTQTSDLWDALEASTGMPVRQIAESWILQGGFPLVTVDLVDEGRTLRLGQEPFGYAGDLGEGKSDTTAPQRRWQVPVLVTQSGGGALTVERELITESSLDVQLVEPARWVVANTQGTGFYRVAYAPDLLDALVARAADELSPLERYGIVDDAWAAVLADRMGIVDILRLLPHFTVEEDLTVWQRIVGVIDAIDRLVTGEDPVARWQTMVAELVGPAFERLGTTPRNGDDDRSRQLRGTLFTALGTIAADPATRILATDLLTAATDDPSAVDPAMTAAAIAVVAHTGGREVYEDFVRRVEAAPTPQDEMRLLTALADFQEPALLDETMAMCLDGRVRTQNAPYLLRRTMANTSCGDRAWAFVSTHWDAINDTFPTNSIARMLEGIRYLDRPEVANLVFAFFSDHEVPQGDRIVAQHLERLEVALALRERSSGPLAHELSHH